MKVHRCLFARPLTGAAGAFAVAGLLSACAVGPDFNRPAAPAIDGYTREPLAEKTVSTEVAGGEAQKFLRDRDIPADWWMLFQSPQLNTLVDKALKANPTVQAAQAALYQAQALARAQRGLFFPNVQGSYSRTRGKDSATLGPTTTTQADANSIFKLHTAQVAVSYAPDVFGGIRRSVESRQAQADSQGFQLEATYLTLTSNVVAAAVQEASLRAQIAAAREIIAINTKSVELLRRRFAVGFVAGLDVAAQEAALAQAEQALPPLQKQLEQTRNLLSALAGRFPAEGSDETFELSGLRLPEDLPLSLPSRLVEQRPDVRAAEELLHAASADVGVATAAMLPQFNITAVKGGTAIAFSEMFANGNPFWTFTAGLTQTLFAGGTLLYQKRAAEAALQRAAAGYRSTVIGAFQNVADVLYALQADAEALRAAVKAERTAKVTLDIVSKQLALGQVNYLALLAAQQTYQQALSSLAQAQANRFADTAALFQALGGGWWNRSDTQARYEHSVNHWQ